MGWLEFLNIGYLGQGIRVCWINGRIHLDDAICITAFRSALSDNHKAMPFYRQIVLRPLVEFVSGGRILKMFSLALEINFTESYARRPAGQVG